ncbi:VOC family protein [Paenarthrobacter sp. DKR-5]|uniref:VOC family protein n=1 Tax=Paenarthrobacter sp. DKR-5 TaxID=2835535 RepID=UPI001BDD4316|nr:VOC family protein [Paenarthrobacter sp. DKR-5]MBT1004432.1 VOC family protein [Paenarthrobacter sp. DKR-5]
MSGVVHFEIPADDVARASEFYRTAFGWEMQPMPDMEYTLLMTTPVDEKGQPTRAGSINGGMFKRTPENSHPVVTVDVEDIDAALEKIEELGGSTAMTKQPVGEMGFTAYFKDSEGNLIGLWQNA